MSSKAILGVMHIIKEREHNNIPLGNMVGEDKNGRERMCPI